LERLAAAIDSLNERLGRLAAWLLGAVIVTVFSVVVLRYGFGWGRVWLQETYTWLNATAVLLGAAYTLKHDAHVRIDLLYERWGRRRRALADLVGAALLLLPFTILVLLVSRGYVTRSWRILESSREAGGLPGVFLLKTLIPLAAVLLLLQGIVLALRAARDLGRGGDG
jgi:TRAP-type mannitol/chloroaromatic compound transport system permease small subunit